MSDLTNFNQLNRDRWVEQKARSLPTGSKVLDVGAGCCRYRSLFDHCDYKTQDFAQYKGTQTGLTAGKFEYGHIDYVCDITSIPVSNETFDALLCTEVLEHVPNPLEALRELARILRKGGSLFLTAPLGCGLHQMPYIFYGGFTPSFYRRFLPQFGLEIVELRPNGGFFRHFLQEADRAASAIIARWPASKHDVFRRLVYRVVLGWGFQEVIPKTFSHLDDLYPIEEFTVGYFVEATKARGSDIVRAKEIARP